MRLNHWASGKPSVPPSRFGRVQDDYVAGVAALSGDDLDGSARAFGACDDAATDDECPPLWVGLFSRVCPPPGDPLAPYCIKSPVMDTSALSRGNRTDWHNRTNWWDDVDWHNRTDDAADAADADANWWDDWSQLGATHVGDPVGRGAMLSFVSRAYLEPETRVGPSPDELVQPVIVRFERSGVPVPVVSKTPTAAPTAADGAARRAAHLRGAAVEA